MLYVFQIQLKVREFVNNRKEYQIVVVKNNNSRRIPFKQKFPFCLYVYFIKINYKTSEHDFISRSSFKKLLLYSGVQKKTSE